MNKNLIAQALTLSLLTGFTGAYANDIGYTYLEGSYNKTNDDSDSKGFAIQGSYEINENIYITGEYLSSNGSENAVDIDGNGYSAGVGYHTSIAEKTDVYGEAAFVKAEVEGKLRGRPLLKQEADGVELAVGVRSRLNDMFEVQGEISHFDSDTSVDVKGLYHINNQFAVGATVKDLNDSEKTLGIFARVKSL